MAESKLDRARGSNPSSRRISSYFLIGFLSVLMGIGMWLQLHLPAKKQTARVSVTAPFGEPEPAATQPAIAPSANVPFPVPIFIASTSDVYVVTADTAMVRRDSDGQTVYELIEAGTELTLLDRPENRNPDELLRARTVTGKEGRVPAGRIKLSLARVPQVDPVPQVKLAVIAAPPVPAAIPIPRVPAVSDAVVRRSINSAVQFLRIVQGADGSWEQVPAPQAGGRDGALDAGQWGFSTGMAAEALVGGGLNFRDQDVVRACGWLVTAKLSGTYAVAARERFFRKYSIPQGGYPPKSIKGTIADDEKLLLGGGALGGNYGYVLPRVPAPAANNAPLVIDRFATAFAVQAVHALEANGRQIPGVYWSVEELALDKDEAATGGFARFGLPTPADPEFAAATAAGAASLNRFDSRKYNIRCRPADLAIYAEKTWQRLGAPGAALFGPVELEPGTPPMIDNLTPLLVTEAATIAGQKYVGKTVWYPTLVTQLLKTQNPDGSWGKQVHSKVVETALAVIALSTARAPVVMNKLVEPFPGKRDFGSRPRDVGNFADWYGVCLSSNINWQTVTLTSADDLADSNVLFIAGSGDLKLTPIETALLKKYLADGGTILANADCSKPAFTKAFTTLAGVLLPGAASNELPENHPLYKDQIYKRSKWRTKPKVIGWISGGREAILLIPDADASKAWEENSSATKKELFELGADIIQYAGGTKPR